MIIQATYGCRYNQCSFCSMYKQKVFRARPLDGVFAHIDEAAREWPEARRVFLADGDAYCLPTEALAAICDHLALRFADLQRISAYATPFDILGKSEDDIALLKAKRLGLVYLGIESGSDMVLKRIAKGSAKQMESALAKARQCGLKVSATVILGLAGKNGWEDHMDGTADLVNRAPPVYLSTLQLGLETNVAPRFFERMGEDFQWQDDRGVLVELRRLLERLNPPSPVIFRSNHASNALALAGNLPRDKDKLLARIDAALDEGAGVRPRWIRGF
ncbi:radical SAM protein [Paramagnetospirillum magnetotacticum]|uniref:radical SAM protein n=1 Tax=Paramagnetospirillum magnetotacticum TaxID=188 RepID=UPI0002E9411F|nr:radical SAM protein [Paramagnetospirillum magnetotacticum]